MPPPTWLGMQRGQDHQFLSERLLEEEEELHVHAHEWHPSYGWTHLVLNQEEDRGPEEEELQVPEEEGDWETLEEEQQNLM